MRLLDLRRVIVSPLNAGLLVIGLSVIFLIWLGVWRNLESRRDFALEHSRNDGLFLTSALAENLTNLIDRVDPQLLMLKQRYELDPNRFDLAALVASTALTSRDPLQVSLMDRHGVLLGMVGAENAPPSSTMRTASLQYHASGVGDGLHIKTSRSPDGSKETLIQISRRLDGPDGAMAGVLAISIDPSYFKAMVAKFEIGAKSRILIVPSPAFPIASGSLQTIADRPEDGVKSLIIHHALTHFPITIVLSLPLADIYSDEWVDGVIVRSLAIVATLAILLMGLFALLSALRGLDYQRQLLENATRFEDFARSASELQWETDRDDRFCWFSEGAAATTKGDAEKMLGRHRIDYAVDPTDPAWALYRQCVAQRLPFRDLVTERYHVDGETWFVRISGVPVFDRNGDFCGYRGTSSNVTAERAARQRVELAEAQLRGITQNLPGVVFQIRRAADGSDFRYTYFSDRSLEYLGCEPEAAMADYRCVMANFLPEDQAEIERILMNPPPIDQPRSYTYRVLSRGKVRWLEYVSQSRLDRDGSIITDGFAMDVTASHERETQIKIAYHRADLANQAKSRFLAHVSHELRTPLNAIIGFSEVIHEQIFGNDQARYVEYAGHIHESGIHLLSIINDILDLSRVDAGQFVLTEAQADLRDVIESANRLVGIQAERKQIAINQSVSVEGPLYCDRRLLIQVLVNVLSNAVKFTPIGGHISLNVFLADDHTLRINITDDGVGMSEDEIAQAFEPFRRGEAMVRQESEGTGLGLAICKRLMELHGGEIAMSCQDGQGVMVSLAFPKHRCRTLDALAA